MKKTIIVFALTFLLADFHIVAQTSEPLDNKRVIELYEKGVSPSIIKRKIEEGRTNFDVSDDALIKLAEHKIPADIQDAMVEAKHRSSGFDKAALNDPLAPHESGIYVELDASGKKELKKMFSTPINQGKTDYSGKMIPIFGSLTSGKESVCLSGNEAQVQIDYSNNPPVFYFYFKPGKKDLGKSSVDWSFQDAESPHDFSLIKLICKKDRRCIKTGSSGGISNSSGIDSKQIVKLSTPEELAPGIFKVTPLEKLEQGEYCFKYGGNTPHNQGQSVFDFGMLSREQSQH